MSAVHRILDANINRAAEGMRVLEDIARFTLENKKLCSAIKKCRHELRTQTPEITSRDVKADIGTTVSTKAEGTRDSMHDVALAAGNRCAEALRVVEEFLKLESIKNTVESIRYSMYDLADEVVNLLGATHKHQWKLCFVMTMDQCVLPWFETLEQSLVAGVDCIQIREKEMSTARLIEYVFLIQSIAKRYNAQVIVNDRVDVMLATNADGVHLGKSDMSLERARKICGSEYIIGTTVHELEDLLPAIQSGADYVGVGAAYPSSTKPEVLIASFGLLKNSFAYNHLAIGGITPQNVQNLYAEGCKGIAVSSAIANSTRPERVVAALLQPEHQSV